MEHGMAADIIKFTKARKALSRAEKDQQAMANRAKFGRTKEQRAKEAANALLAAQRLAGLKLPRKPKVAAGRPDGEGSGGDNDP
jgi:hypothetical protein